MGNHPRAHALRGFHSSRGAGFHRISPLAGCSGIASGHPFPARTHSLASHWPTPRTETSGLLLLAQGLPACLVLAPCMQLSLHTAPTSRFPRLAIRGVEAGNLRGALRAVTKRVAVWLGWRPLIDPPPKTDEGPSGPSTGSVCRTTFACRTQVLRLHQAIRNVTYPPSFDVIAKFS